jgi:acetyl esterase/lipase
MLDPSLFAKESVPPELVALNESILRQAQGTPTFAELGAEAWREVRGAVEFVDGERARCEDISIPADVPVGARVFFPKPGTDSVGALLHVHGGGFIFGSARGQNDTRLLRHAQNCGLTVVSVDYRLSPENVYPAALQDCTAAAEWLATPAGRTATRIRADAPLFLVGESAGGNLAAAMLPILKEQSESGTTPFKAVVLVYGWYDLSELPFFKHWGGKRLVESADDLRWFRSQYLGPLGTASSDSNARDLKDPKLSPLYADLRGLPPALFVVGTEDALLDDSIFMQARWISSGNPATLKVYPGAAHGMGHFGPHQHTSQGEQVLQDIEAFYLSHLHDG